MAEFDHRVKGGNLFYQAWYNQGLRAIDISNPFRPREVGYYISREKCRLGITPLGADE